MTDFISQITLDLQKQIDAFQPAWDVTEVGTVVDAGDGIAHAGYAASRWRRREHKGSSS